MKYFHTPRHLRRQIKAKLFTNMKSRHFRHPAWNLLFRAPVGIQPNPLSMKISHTSPRLRWSAPLCLALSGIASQAAPLFSESFDTDQAKVKVIQRTSAA